MSQIPPPPPSQPAPMGGAPGAAGSNKKTILAYLLGWITGLIFLFVAKDDPDVKWNAANSIIVFGSLSVVSLVTSYIPVVNVVVFLVGFVFWAIFMVQAIQGTGQRIPAPGIAPYINRYVDQLANAVK